MRSRWFTVFAVTSLLLCLGTLTLDWRSGHRRDRLCISLPWGRYTFISRDEVLLLRGPPKPGGADETRAWALAARLRNSDVHFDVRALRWSNGVAADRWIDPRTTGSAAASLQGLGGPEVTRPLLQALDDPERFAA